MDTRKSQQGMTLFVSLILLVMVTLLAVSSFRVSNTNLKIVSSMQGRNEAISAAQTAIEQVISSSNFTTNPTAVQNTPIPVDINGNGTADYTVTFTPAPRCMRSRLTPTTALSITNPQDVGCFGSVQMGGVGEVATSNCADTLWEIVATTQDPVTQAQTTVRQGISIRLDKGTALNTCH